MDAKNILAENANVRVHREIGRDLAEVFVTKAEPPLNFSTHFPSDGTKLEDGIYDIVLIKKSTPAVAGKTESDLPADFPFRGDLIEGEFSTMASVKAASDAQLLALKHIGDAALADIRAAAKSA